jgi:hypothetical protein
VNDDGDPIVVTFKSSRANVRYQGPDVVVDA